MLETKESEKTKESVKEETKKGGHGKKMFAILGLLVVAGVVVGAVLGTQNKGAAAQNSGGTTAPMAKKSMAFMIPAGMSSGFDGMKSDFVGDLAFTAERTADDFMITNTQTIITKVNGVVGSYEVVTVQVSAETADAVDIAIAKLYQAANSNSYSKYNVVAAVQDASTVHDMATLPPTGSATAAPTTSGPTQAPTTAAPVAFKLLMNCGNLTPFFATDGTAWQPDQFFTGGVNWAKGTSGNPLWDSERFFQNLVANEGYHIPVPQAGIYQVNATFVELTATAIAGYRTFSIVAEGSNLSTQYAILDVFVLAGGYNKPYMVTKNVAVNDGVLDLTIVKMKQNPIINMLTVEYMGPVA